MIFRFAGFELDADRRELRHAGVRAQLEPQVFALLLLLVRNRTRAVTKAEILAHVWNGRLVSESALSSRIKSLRQAVGDSGREQAVIRTVHGTGFRFVADVTECPPVVVADRTGAELSESSPGQRPSIAILPFEYLGVPDPAIPIAEALPSDLISALSKLHWLFVIARGSSFRFRSRDTSIAEIRSALHVQYCVTGVIEASGSRLSVLVELSDATNNGIIWSEKFQGVLGSVHEIRDEIINAVTSAVEVRIAHHEAQRALLKAPENLDAWSSYHLGIRHMYRFNKADNELATAHFERAIVRDPGFARAYAGLSFTHFQNAFLRYSDGPSSARLAHRHAANCLERDPHDPFGHFTMGRAHWLQDDLEGSLPWLERATALNPNYAQAKYSRGWAEALLGSAEASQRNIASAIALSPLDPLLYGMLGVQALSHLVVGNSAQAAVCAERAANTAGAHALIEMIAVTAHGLNGNDAKARAWAGSIRRRAAHLDKRDFLRAFPFRDVATRERVSAVLGSLGF